MTDIKSLVERLRFEHGRLTSQESRQTDYGDAADLIEQQAARIAELSTCKLCRSTGHDTPCAYPTEINRQQAKRIAELESQLVKANDAWLALSQSRNAEPAHKFALIRDRNYEGEGLSLWTWNGENYSGADGDCLSPDTDGTLDGYTVEWLTDYQLEQRLRADSIPDYERKFQHEIRELVMRHIDRMGDICEQDPAERIIESFTTKFDPIFGEYLSKKFPDRGLPVGMPIAREGE